MMSSVVAARPAPTVVAGARIARPAAGLRMPRPVVLPRNVRMICRADPKEMVEGAIKNAEETCKDGTTGECAAAWDEVEEISAAISHKKEAAALEGKPDPLDEFCKEEPDSAECRVYED